METLSVLPDGRIGCEDGSRYRDHTGVPSERMPGNAEQSNKPNHGRLCRTQRKNMVKRQKVAGNKTVSFSVLVIAFRSRLRYC